MKYLPSYSDCLAFDLPLRFVAARGREPKGELDIVVK